MAEIRLTPQQQSAVEHRGSTLLVSAAAGSGKTKVLLDRVLRRVAEEQCSIDDFLMITFTQAAAAELRGKLLTELSTLLASRPDDRHLQRQMNRVYLAQISTVHAFCNSLLREYAHLLELPADFRLCDETEAAAIRERVMKQVLEAAYAAPCEDFYAAVDMLGAGRDDRTLSALILRIYESARCWRDADKRMEMLRESLDFSEVTDAGETIWGRFLLDETHTVLADALASMAEMRDALANSESLTPYLPTFDANIALLEALLAAGGWDALREIPKGFGRLRSVTKSSEPELQKRAQDCRKQVKARVEKALERFAVSSAAAIADMESGAPALRGLLALTTSFAQAYREEKLRRHLLDYGDLEHETLRLLYGKGDTPTAAAREISGRFVEIMVDEYQDTNAVQDAIFQAISKRGMNLFLVGDVKQSIYGFRLADPTIFLKKYNDYPNKRDAAPGEPCKVLLSDNFRSHERVLAAANDVFRLCMTPRVGGLYYGEEEALRAGRNDIPQTPPVELHCINTKELSRCVSGTELEAEFVACRIARMLDEGETIPDGQGHRPIRPEDIVILLRSISGKAAIYTAALRRHGIRSVCDTDDLFGSEEIVVLLALLQILDNPHQDIPLLTVLLSCVGSFSAETLALARAKKRDGDLCDALHGSAQGAVFLESLAVLRDTAAQTSLHGLLDALDERFFLREKFGAMDDGARRQRNIDAFYAIADAFESGGNYGLSAFLQRLERMRGKGKTAEAEQSSGAVRLMSIHKSKGLEFPVVILADVGKRFNLADATQNVLVDSVLGIGATVFDSQARVTYPTLARTAIAARIRRESISEEMRLLYVAMTRAQYRLIMTVSSGSMETKLSKLAASLPPRESLIESAGSMGDWLLMTALMRTEAGELLALAGEAGAGQVTQFPWKITACDGNDYLPREEAQAGEAAQREPLLPYFPLHYAHEAASRTPAKLTATQLKGRALDEELETPPVAAIRFTKPLFTRGIRPLTASERGTAIHLAMQYLRYEVCTDEAAIARELAALVEKKQISAQQAQAVPPEKLLRFFRSPLGQRVLHAEACVREFKFSILEEGFDSALEGEQVLLQGVTDCCLIENGALTVLDFKSDSIQPGEEAERAAYYRGQLDAYSRALSQIFELPVRERLLYFFATDRPIAI